MQPGTINCAAPHSTGSHAVHRLHGVTMIRRACAQTGCSTPVGPLTYYYTLRDNTTIAALLFYTSHAVAYGQLVCKMVYS